MNAVYAALNEAGSPWLTSAVFVLAGLAIGALCQLLVSWLVRRRQRTLGQVNLILADAGTRPLMLWGLLLGTWLAVQAAPLPQHAAHIASQTVLVAWIVSLTFVASRLCVGLIAHYGARLPGGWSTTSLTQNVAQAVVVVIGGLAILNVLGVSIMPLLTALGVGGVAVALAMQDTLSNLFAGFYLGLGGSIRVGDYIKLSTGEEGYITDIGWRATTLKALSNNLVIVPNAMLAKAIVTNYHLPSKATSTSIVVGVSYSADVKQVEQLLLEAARQTAAEVPELLTEPPPQVQFKPGFGPSSLDLTLSVNIADFTAQWNVQDQLRRRVLAKFRESNIEIPYPTHTVELRNDVLSTTISDLKSQISNDK